jgi:NADH:ubiquinone oxidoreductase subunit 6 (subunit J)
MKYKKEIIFMSIYLMTFLILFNKVENENVKNIMNKINYLGIGFLGTSLLIIGIEDIINRMVKSGRLIPEMKVERSLFTVYLFLFGFTSLILYMSEKI